MSAAAYILDDAALRPQCRIERCRAGGPGGQHMQKTESAIRVVHLATGVEARCSDHRDRARNEHDALQRVRLRLALHQRGCSEVEWLNPYRQGRRIILRSHATHYPVVVAVLLDALLAHQGRLAEAAEMASCSTSQLVKVLGADKEVLVAANQLRAEFNQGPLHV